MPVEIPLRCKRRDANGNPQGRQTKNISLELIYEPGNLPEVRQERIKSELRQATQSAFKRAKLPDENEVAERAFGTGVKILILVKHRGKVKGYYSLGTMTVQPENATPRNVVFLHASVLHRDVKGYGLMNLMQSAGILMGKEYYRLQGKTAHLLAARVQKQGIADRLRHHLGRSDLNEWWAVARRLHPDLQIHPQDAAEGIIRGAIQIPGGIYGETTTRSPSPNATPQTGYVGGIQPAQGDVILLVSRAQYSRHATDSRQEGADHEKETPQLTRRLRFHQIASHEFRHGFLGQTLEWTAPETYAHLNDPSKTHVPVLIMHAIQNELTGRNGSRIVVVNPVKEKPL
ncbi:hypothetical protein HY572_03810 [Candidatus Micrarchaeota archaeon]|nr:hypothetical protein [Candidatus Micrarchaeota archaeon]